MPLNEQQYIRSESVNEIMGQPPHWMMRWGITVIFIIILGILGLSFIIRYPEVVSGTAIITTNNPPVKLVAKTGGNISSLLIGDSTKVNTNQTLLVIQNPLTYQTVLQLDSLIAEIKNAIQKDSISAIKHIDSLLSGELQTEINNLNKNISDYQYFIQKDIQGKRLSSLSKQLQQYKSLVFITNRQVELSKADLKQAEQKFETEKKLFEQKVIAQFEFIKEEGNYRQSIKMLEETKKIAIQNSITFTDIEKQFVELEYEIGLQKRNYITALTQSIINIENYINSWQQSFVLVAPIQGKATFLQELSKNKYINAGTPLIAVVPEKSEVIAQALIQATGFGKIKIGQRVRLKLVNFPYQEYGQINGIIKQLALLPNENHYRVSISLPQGLKTSYHQVIPYKPEIPCIAEVITNDLSLLDRLFFHLRKLSNK